MLVPHIMSGQTVGVLGLGSSGMAAAASLYAAGVTIFAHDDNKADTRLANGTVMAWQDWPWQDLKALVISPGIPHLHPAPHPAAAHAAAKNIEIISEVEIALRAAPQARIVVITGTNGKSTTTALVGHCLQQAGKAAAVGGNIGQAACLLDDPGPDGVIVLELSSYQLETTPALSPTIAVVLNITPDHLDRHAGMAGYVAAKTRALFGLRAESTAILGQSDDHVKQLANTCRDRGIRTLLATLDKAPAGRENCLALRGDHNAENAAAAGLVLHCLGLDVDQIDHGMASFVGLPHRLQTVATIGPISFVNDSKATNGTAAAKAVAAFSHIYWVAGGLAKEDGVDAVMPHIRNVEKAYLIGNSAAAFAETLHGHCPAGIYNNLHDATHAAFNDAKENVNGGTILLAPAAASFDQFDNFGARGDAFCQLARQLCSQKGEAYA
jgi:UDP-N-acetylmuramoylalanine--D-glutamate ligase